MPRDNRREQMTSIFARLAAGLGLGLLLTSAASAETATINGLDLFYEVAGTGKPLVLLHGAYMNNDTWGGLKESLAEKYQVIAVETQLHGRTGDRDTPITYENMSADIVGLLDHLKIDKAIFVGYSMGGATAIRVAIDHPERVERIVAASAGYRYDVETMGQEYVDMIDTITPEMFAGTPFEAEYKRLSPNPENFPVLVEKLKQLDLSFFDWSADFARIEVPSLYIFGDADIVGADVIAEMHQSAGGRVNADTYGLPKTQLMVLPGTSHIGVFFNPANVEIIKTVIPTFLEQQLPAAPVFPG